MPSSRYKPKIEKPLGRKEFFTILYNGEFKNPPRDKAFLVLLYYTGVRVSEAIHLTRSQFFSDENYFYIDIGTRLKHSLKTRPVRLLLSHEGVGFLLRWSERFKPDERIFNFNRVTAWKIAKDQGFYPHYFRFSRITNWFLQGRTIPEVKGMIGISVQTMSRYILDVATRAAWEETV